MKTITKAGGLMAAAIAASLAIATPTMARPWHHHGGGWHRGGAGAALGFATGALIGGALASRPYYAYGPGPYVVDEGYASGGAVEYCMRRFKSYDVASGTYLGYDGIRHPCP